MRIEENIPGIIDDLYAGTLDDAAWDRGIMSMADLISGSAALLFCYNPANGQVLRDENHRVDPVALAQYSSYWCTHDLRLGPSWELPVATPIFDAKILPAKTWKMSDIYNDLLIPEDAPWILAFWLHKSWDKVVNISFQGSRRRGPFDVRDGERIQPLIPHLRRALEIKDRLELTQIRADTLAKSLNNVSFGVMLLGATGHILEANAVAEQLLRCERVINRNPDGTLWLQDPAGTEFERWIIKGVPPSTSDGLLKLPRLHANPISILITSLPPSATSWMGGDPRWLVLVFDPDRRLAASVELIARDLGISAREAEIAAQLVLGYDIKLIASRLNISVHTVRTHVKAIFARTGIRSQGELIQRIANGPAGCLRSI